MSKVTNLKAYRALKNPIMAICQQIDNHYKFIQLYRKDLDLLFNNEIRQNKLLKVLTDVVWLLTWSNIVSWIVIGGLIWLK